MRFWFNGREEYEVIVRGGCEVSGRVQLWFEGLMGAGLVRVQPFLGVTWEFEVGTGGGDGRFYDLPKVFDGLTTWDLRFSQARGFYLRAAFFEMEGMLTGDRIVLLGPEHLGHLRDGVPIEAVCMEATRLVLGRFARVGRQAAALLEQPVVTGHVIAGVP